MKSQKQHAEQKINNKLLQGGSGQCPRHNPTRGRGKASKARFPWMTEGMDIKMELKEETYDKCQVHDEVEKQDSCQKCGGELKKVKVKR